MPDPTFGVDVGRVHRAKHGSGTGAYDAAGRFVPQKFEDIFSQYGTQDAKGRRGIDGRGIMAMVAGNRNVLDPVGWIFQVFLWGFLWLLAADRSGFVSKEDVRRQYDGTLYREIEARRKKGEKLPWWRGGTGF
ncbi:Caleosin [Hyaloraphidium curvatum]|nr:Caleosin [Hyaloraphidium curvatum]